MKYFDQTRRLLAALMLSAIPLFAQIDTSSFTTQTNSFITLGLYIAAGACVLAFAFGIFKLIGRDLMAGIRYIIGALIGGYIIGHAITWTSTITGQTLSTQ